MNSTKFYEDYEKLKTVGQGAFGTATLYRRIHDGKQVVMKEVFIMDMDNSERKAALNEVEILSTLNHPNIIRALRKIALFDAFYFGYKDSTLFGFTLYIRCPNDVFKYLGSFQKEGSLIIIMEYADGGNLAQLINAKKNKNETFTEKSILNITSQISAALGYMHSNKILHRDLKSANIFLNMNGNIKVGDFGISKMLNTRSQAQTVVGTPYYLSPEMCEGYDYNEKSDIWAIGCILYELTSLRKPFEAMTLPVLVQKITSCEYDDIPKIYSEELSQLVRSILQKNPAMRPSAKYIHDTAVPKVQKKILSLTSTAPSTIGTSFKLGVPRERSVLYKLHDFGDDQKVEPQELPHKKILDYSISSTHHIVVTIDNYAYTWGDNNFGQLALSDGPRKKTYAAHVDFLKGVKVERCAAGKGFSIFLSSNGAVYSCGDGRQGCLGHGDWNCLARPTIINALKGEKITQICCGEEHVVALSSEGKVFTWGSSKSGQLGQGHMQCRCKPLAIKLLNLTKIKSIFCGENESVLLTITGQVLVAGDNNYNKLGIPQQDKIALFTPVSNLKDKIKFVSIGRNHTIMLTETGTLIACGRNHEGQFGKGSFTDYSGPQTVKLKMKITMIASGTNFTVAGDNKNVLWFWGSSYKTLKNVKMANTQKIGSSNSVVPLFKTVPDETLIIKNFGIDSHNEEFQSECIRVPEPILALYSSQNNIKTGNIIHLAEIKIKSDNLYVLTHTTAPPPVKQFSSNEVHNRNTMSQMEDTTIAPSTLTNLPNVV